MNPGIIRKCFVVPVAMGIFGTMMNLVKPQCSHAEFDHD